MEQEEKKNDSIMRRMKGSGEDQMPDYKLKVLLIP